MIRLRSSEGWNAKSKPASVLRMGSRAMRNAALTRRFSRKRQFLGEQIVDGLDAVDLALLDAAQRGVEHLERARHLQADQAVADIVDARGWRGERHGRPAFASCSPIAW